MQLPVISLFSGCGGLDLGFAQAGFDIIWANEFDKDIWKTYEANHGNTVLNKRNIREISSKVIPDCIGIIGGPPCQSWSEAGTQKGMNDERGQLFLEYIRILRDKKPLFFLAENVSGMLHQKHEAARKNIIAAFQEAGYKVAYKLLDAKTYNVPQERKRVIFIGYRIDLNQEFSFNHLMSGSYLPTLRDSIADLWQIEIPATENNRTREEACNFQNHEYMQGGFSSIYMSRNRVRSWNEPSFTIQAGGRHAPIHPQANKMIHTGKDQFAFDLNSPYPYRRLSVRECARIQTFPDKFIFHYNNLISAYKMIGNAVPVNLSFALAQAIKHDLFGLRETPEARLESKLSPQLSLNIS